MSTVPFASEVAPPPGETADGKAAPPRVHLDFLDGIRGVAALIVVLDHAWLQSYPWVLFRDSFPSARLDAAAGWLIYAGHFAVTVFITLSGFCLMLPVLRSGGLRGGWKGFFAGRVRRILPPYYAALLGSILLGLFVLAPKTHSLYDSSLPVTRHGVLLHVLLLQDLSTADRAQINGPMWSIAVECQIYLLFPLFVWVWKRFGIAPVIALAGLLAAGLWAVVHGTYRDGMQPQYLFIFALGMLAALLAFQDTAPDPTPPTLPLGWFAAAAVAAMAALLVCTWRTGLAHLDLADLLMGTATAAVLVGATRNPRDPIRRVMSLGPVVFVGGFSYSLYLIHFPLQQVLWQYLVHPSGMGRTAQFLTIAGPGTLLIVAVSYGFYRVLERPFMRMKPRA